MKLFSAFFNFTPIKIGDKFVHDSRTPWPEDDDVYEVLDIKGKRYL